HAHLDPHSYPTRRSSDLRAQATVASSKDGTTENQTRNFSDGARVKGCCSSGGESQDCINACAERKTKFVKYSCCGESGENGRLLDRKSTRLNSSHEWI